MSSDKLTQAEKKIVEQAKKDREQAKKEANIFWKEKYPMMSQEDKINLWLAEIHKGMRTQGEEFADKYSYFSKDDYVWCKEVEPDFDTIFNEVVKKLGFEFNWSEYYSRIKE